MFRIALFLSLALTSNAFADDQRLSLPWQLRPLTTDNLVSIETAASAFNDANGNLDIASSTVIAASYHLDDSWAPMLRVGLVGNDAPGEARDGASLGNPVAGLRYLRAVDTYRVGFTGAAALPIGMGGGNSPEARAAKTDVAASVARPGDDAMFDVDYFTAIGAVDAAYVNHGFTVQGEASLLQSVRVRGDQTAAGADLVRTNSAVAMHLGYFIGSHVSVGTDVRYQRWLSHPSLDAMTSPDNVTAALGVRVHVCLGDHTCIHPGLSFAAGTGAATLQLSVPVTFGR